MKFKVTITKEVIDKSLMCGVEPGDYSITENCAFAVVYNELIPNISVGASEVSFYGKSQVIEIERIQLTKEQKKFIVRFDAMITSPYERYKFVGKEFDIEIPDGVIDYWFSDSIKAVQKIINNPIIKVI